ncbi:hypothetical protein ACFWNK_12405 [Streptomyces sp. NPDC058417]|uniref:hypothetical protein n=1 Tax=unclassified Streptomyces TaxID=2593676 RepID=UPI00365504FD
MRHHAVLTGPGGESLAVIRRPRYQQFMVVPLVPSGFADHHFSDVDAPNGIKVPNDDVVRAGAAVSRRVLPRLAEALAALNQAAQHQPLPPHRLAAPEVSQSLTLVLYPDGVIGAPYRDVPKAAYHTLYSARFQYNVDQYAFVLPTTYSTTTRAELLTSVIRRLTAQGIGVNFRDAAPLPTTAQAVAAPAPIRPPTPQR